LDLDGKTVLVFHGHERGFARAVRSAGADYVLCGHTHRADDVRVGRTRVINPGALSRARPPSVAVLDTAVDDLTFYALEQNGEATAYRI
jgi:predicted phosphodiesterase